MKAGVLYSYAALSLILSVALSSSPAGHIYAAAGLVLSALAIATDFGNSKKGGAG